MKTSLLAIGGVLVIVSLYHAQNTAERRSALKNSEQLSVVTAQLNQVLLDMQDLSESVKVLKQAADKLKPTTKVITKVKVVYRDKPDVQLACNSPELPKNRIALGMGLGTDGIVYRKADRTVRERVGTVISADYARRFTNGNSVGIGVQSNKSVVIKLGKDF